MTYIISSLDHDEIRRYSKKGRIAAAEKYYEIRKSFGEWSRWYKFKDVSDVLRTIDGLLDSCLAKMQESLDKTPIESSCGDWAGSSTTGVHVSLRWIRYNEEARKHYAEKYRGLYLNDYVMLTFTFEIVDAYEYREKPNDIHKS